MNIFVVNESKLLNDVEAFNIAWACNYQAQYHFGRSGWRSDVRVHYLPGGASAKIPAGGSVLHLLDTADQPGALGYHDEDGNEVPYARVFVKTARDDHQQASEVASHEALELAADPNINLCALNHDGTKLFAVEVGDPVQGNGYDVGEPQGRTTGVVVADFTLPNYFDPNTKPGEAVDFRGKLKGPFTLAPQGYYSYVDLSNVQAGWQQAVGRERTAPPAPDKDDRTGRRVSVAPA